VPAAMVPGGLDRPSGLVVGGRRCAPVRRSRRANTRRPSVRGTRACGRRSRARRARSAVPRRSVGPV